MFVVCCKIALLGFCFFYSMFLTFSFCKRIWIVHIYALYQSCLLPPWLFVKVTLPETFSYSKPLEFSQLLFGLWPFTKNKKIGNKNCITCLQFFHNARSLFDFTITIIFIIDSILIFEFRFFFKKQKDLC